MMKRSCVTSLKRVLVASLLVVVVGCGAEEGGAAQGGEHAAQAGEQGGLEDLALEVIGTWASPWGTDSITAEKWNSAFITEFDNETNHAITEQPTDDEYNPGKFSKIVWTEVLGDSFYYCTVVFGKDTAEEAANTEDTANRRDLNGEGCGGFPWTKLIPAIEVHGTWTSEWGTESVTSHLWNQATVVSYDNETNTAITRNPEDDEYNPGKFNKLVWTDLSTDGTFHYCTVAFDQDTAATALTTADTSNTADLDGAGCGGFQWTRLDVVE